MDMGKYVAVGVLAVIVLAAVTYQPPERTIGKRVETRGQQLQGSYGAPTPPEVTAPPELPPGPGQVSAPVAPATPAPPAPIAEGPAPVSGSSVGGSAHGEYTVKRGQTLSDIAGEVLGDRGRWKELYDANRDRLPSPDQIREGMVLVFEQARAAAHELTAPRTASAAPAPAAPAPVAAPAPAGGRTYVVVQGDTLYSIARRQLGQGSRWKEIVQLNRLPSEHVGAGTVLQLPN